MKRLSSSSIVQKGRHLSFLEGVLAGAIGSLIVNLVLQSVKK